MQIHSAQFVKGAVSPRGFPNDGPPEVAFAGRSNVGKSSLINMVLGRKSLARTSRRPGKTQEINFYRVNDVVYFVDLPGLGYAKVSKREREAWRRLIASYLDKRPTLQLLFHLIDSRHPPLAVDLELAEMYRGSGVPVIVLATKADKLSGNRRAAATRTVRDALAEIGLELPIVMTSANTGRGREEILEWIGGLLEVN